MKGRGEGGYWVRGRRERKGGRERGGKKRGGEERKRKGDTRHTNPSLLPAPLSADEFLVKRRRDLLYLFCR